MKIIILDDMLKDSPIYQWCLQAVDEWEQPKVEDIVSVDTAVDFIREAQTADFLFCDPGELGNICGNIYDAHRIIFDFMTDHPNKQLTFITHIPPQYYKNLAIFYLVNIDWVDSSLASWQIMKMIAEWLFKNAPLDLFTKKWTNIMEVDYYLPKLTIKTARQVYSQLYDGRSVPRDFPKHHLLKRIEHFYKEKWEADMKRRGIKI